MTEKQDDYPVTTLHRFLEEASKEFKRFRFQAKVNVIGSVILLLLVSRFLLFAFVSFGPPPFNEGRPFVPGRQPSLMHFFLPDWLLLFASLAAVLWSLDVWINQRRFVSRWGERFEKLDALEKKFLSDDKSQS
jgi:hypothetical protein